MTRLSERFDTKFTSKKQFHKGQREQQQGQDQQLQQREEILDPAPSFVVKKISSISSRRVSYNIIPM